MSPKNGGPLLAASLLLHIVELAAPVRVLLYRNRAPAFLQWDSGRPIGWTSPNGSSTWPATDHDQAALGYMDGSLYVIGGERHWSTPTGQRSRSGTPLNKHHEDSPTRLVKEVPLSNGTAKGGPSLLVGRVWPSGGKGVTTKKNQRLVVCGSGQYASARGESSCEVLNSKRYDSDGPRWMFLSLPGHMCGKDTAATGGGALSYSAIVVAGGRCRNDSTSDQVVLLHLFGTTSDRVHHLPPMRHRRAGHSITALADRLVVCGGEVDEDRDSWKCEQLELITDRTGSIRSGADLVPEGATWQYIDDIPPNAGATVRPRARVRHIAAVGRDRLMAITRGGDVFFWQAGEEEDAGWSEGPGLPYEADGVGITVIQGD